MDSIFLNIIAINTTALGGAPPRRINNLERTKNTELPRRVPREAMMRGAFIAAMFIVMV